MQARSVSAVQASLAMIAVGTGVTVSAELVDYPILGAQAVRYALASVLLVGAVRILGRSVPIPQGRDWLWLLGVVMAGLVLFNVAIIRAVETSEPAAVAVIVGAVPLVLLMADSIRLRQRPSPLLIAGVAMVVLGAALVQGGGRATLEGLGWATTALLCEAAFTLLAIPPLRSLGAVGVSIHATWIGAVVFGGLALLVDGTAALPSMGAGVMLAVVYLAVFLTAFAFVFWYRAVGSLGPATAGLFAGLMPIAAAISGIALGLTSITPAVIGGSLVVGLGIAIGLAAGSSGRIAGKSAADGAVLAHGHGGEDGREEHHPADGDEDRELRGQTGSAERIGVAPELSE